MKRNFPVRRSCWEEGIPKKGEKDGVDGYYFTYSYSKDWESGSDGKDFKHLGELIVVSGKIFIPQFIMNKSDLSIFKSQFEDISNYYFNKELIAKTSQTLDIIGNTVVAPIETAFVAASKISPNANMFAKGATKLRITGVGLGAFGIGLTYLDAKNDPRGWRTKHSIDGAMGLASIALSTVCPLFGVAWFAANLVSMYLNDGKSISEYIQDKIDN